MFDEDRQSDELSNNRCALDRRRMARDKFELEREGPRLFERKMQ